MRDPQTTSRLERFQGYMDRLRGGCDILVGALCWAAIGGAIGAIVWLAITGLLLILGA